MLSEVNPKRNKILGWLDRFDETEHERMLKCKGPMRSWHLQMMSELYYNANDPNSKYNFRDPAWFVHYTTPNPNLTSNIDDVLDLLAVSGGLLQETFGLNYTDLVNLTNWEYERIKKKVLEVYEKRLAEQKAQEEEAEQQRLKEEAKRQQEERRRNK